MRQPCRPRLYAMKLYVIHFCCLQREDGSNHWPQHRKTSRCSPSWHEALSEMQARLLQTSDSCFTSHPHPHRGCGEKREPPRQTRDDLNVTFANLIMSGIPAAWRQPAATGLRGLRDNQKRQQTCYNKRFVAEIKPWSKYRVVVYTTGWRGTPCNGPRSNKRHTTSKTLGKMTCTNIKFKT